MKIQLTKRKSKIHRKGIFTLLPIKKGKIFYKVPMKSIFLFPKRKYAYIEDGK